jgi:hypothetical protein
MQSRDAILNVFAARGFWKFACASRKVFRVTLAIGLGGGARWVEGEA